MDSYLQPDSWINNRSHEKNIPNIISSFANNLRTKSALVLLLLSSHTPGNHTAFTSWIHESWHTTLSIQDHIWEPLFGKKIDQFSHATIKTYPITIDQKTIGYLQTLTHKANIMFVSSNRSHKRFFNKNFPLVSVIKRYDASEKQETSFLMPWPTYEKNDKVTWLWFDNGVAVGAFTLVDLKGKKDRSSFTKTKDIAQRKAIDRWIMIIQWGKVTLTHTSSISPDQLSKKIEKKADICTMTAVMHKGKLNTHALRWWPWSYITTNYKWDNEIIHFPAWITKEQAEKVFRKTIKWWWWYFMEIVAGDVTWPRWVLNWFWHMDNGSLEYSNLKTGDRRGGKIPPKIIPWKMRYLVRVYEKQ